MSIHIGAEPGQVAESIIISGDPARIRHMAGKYLEDAFCYNEVRGMLGYTGYFQGKRVSMMGTGMGMPSTAIFLHELAHDYGIKTIIRAGTMGALKADAGIGEIFLVMSAGTDSRMNEVIFKGADFAPCADFRLLQKAVAACEQQGLSHSVGQVLSSDVFYSADPDRLKPWIEHHVAGIEMETSAIYTMAARLHLKALSILSVSDNIITGETAPALTRERNFEQMFEVALEIC